MTNIVFKIRRKKPADRLTKPQTQKGAKMEGQLMALAIETYKITLLISLPILATGLVIGLLISIFQATTQINEMTLSFVPKILGVIAVIIFTMPWMLNMLTDYTTHLIKFIPEFIGV